MSMGLQRIFMPLLVAGTTMRLTRLIVTDDVGKWWVREPLREAASEATDNALRLFDQRGHTENEWILRRAQWLNRLDDGVRCPFCVGFWIGVLVMLSHALFGRTRIWRFVATALSLNYVAAHIGSRLGDVDYDDDDEDE